MNNLPDSGNSVFQASQEKKKHLLAADILRGIAILLVVIYHWSLLYYYPWNGWFRDFDESTSHFSAYLYPISLGWTGVALFFVLSGFCIHLSFLRSASFTISRFFWQRFWRIAPAYYVTLIAFCFYSRGFFLSPDWKTQVITHLLFIHNFSSTTLLGINSSFWSLATEVQLYCLFPILLFFRKTFGMEWCLIITLLVGIIWRVGFLVSSWGPNGLELPDHVVNAAFSSPLMNWFDWTLGAFVAERLHQNRMAFHHHLAWMPVFFSLFILSTLYKPLTIFSFSLAAVFFAIFLDLLLRINLPKTIGISAFASLGIVSYSLYLWHQPIISSLTYHVRFIGHFLGNPGVTAAAAALLLVISYLSYLTLERGGIWLGAYLWKKNRKFPFQRPTSTKPVLAESK